MTTYQLLLKYRLKWFRLKAKEFIQRYYMGLVGLVMFLPGVAMGDNFNLFFNALTSPFQQVSLVSSSMISKVLSLLLLQVIFLVFSRAQRQAITGGEFSNFMKSLPIMSKQSLKINLRLLLVSNHILWLVVFASFYYLSGATVLELARNGFLICLLITLQYVFVFKPQVKIVIRLVLISLMFVIDINSEYEIIRMLLLSFLLFVFVRQLLNQKNLQSVYLLKQFQLIPLILKQNFYYQMLFKATLSSTIFRLIILLAFIIGFGLISDFFADKNEGDLLPYALVLEAIIAYYASGFFVCFDDQRQQMQPLFSSLPVKTLFWPIRDYFVVVLITFIMHGLLFILACNYIDNRVLVYLFIYHCLLLLICYPIRLYVKNYQTLLSFVVLFMITAITLFNLS